MRNAPLLVLALMALAASGGHAAATCSVPCGYIYPLIVLSLPDYDGVNPVELADGHRELAGTVTYRWDITNEGYGVPEADKNIVITFEHPKKPAWLDLTVDPPEIPVQPLPIYVVPDTTNPTSPVAHFVYTVPVTLTLHATGPAPADALYSKALTFAKSTESGLYKPAYGIKEVRVATGVTQDDLMAANSVGDANETPLAGAVVTLVALVALAPMARRRA